MDGSLCGFVWNIGQYVAIDIISEIGRKVIVVSKIRIEFGGVIGFQIKLDGLNIEIGMTNSSSISTWLDFVGAIYVLFARNCNDGIVWCNLNIESSSFGELNDKECKQDCYGYKIGNNYKNVDFTKV